MKSLLKKLYVASHFLFLFGNCYLLVYIFSVSVQGRSSFLFFELALNGFSRQ